MALTDGDRAIIAEAETDAQPLTSNEIRDRLLWLLTPAARYRPSSVALVMRDLVGPTTLADDIDPDDLPF